MSYRALKNQKTDSKHPKPTLTKKKLTSEDEKIQNFSKKSKKNKIKNPTMSYRALQNRNPNSKKL